MRDSLFDTLLRRVWRQRLVVPALLCAGLCAARAQSPDAGQDSAHYEAFMTSLVQAQQEALESGDPNRILETSSPVAATALALLDSVDEKGQEDRNALDALGYAEGLLSDEGTEMALLKMELSLGETAQAAELRSHLESTNADNAQVYVGLSQVFEQSSRFDDAVREAQRAVALEPKNRDTDIALGMAFWGLNGFQYSDEALRAFTAAQQADPQGYSSNLLLGTVESQFQRFDAAGQHLRAAITANQSAAEPRYQLGVNAYEASRPAEATEYLEKYLSLTRAAGHENPTQIRRALLILDEAAREQGRTPDPAHRAEEEALKQQIFESRNAHEAGLGTAAGPMGSLEANEDKSAVEKPETPKVDDATIARLRELAASALGNIGAVLARKQNFADAVAPLKYASEEDPSLEAVIRNLGLASCVSGLYQEGEEALKHVVATHPNDRMPRACLGMAEFEAGEVGQSAETFAAAGPVLANNPMFGATAAVAFARAGERDQAEHALADVKDAGGNARLQAREALAYLEAGHADRAAELAKAAVSASQQAPAEALRVLGLVKLAHSNAAGAAEEFRRESEAQTAGREEQIEAQVLLTAALLESGNKSEAEELRGKLLSGNPDLAKKLLGEGQTLLKNGDGYAGFAKVAGVYALAPRDKVTRAAYNSARLAAAALR